MNLVHSKGINWNESITVEMTKREFAMLGASLFNTSPSRRQEIGRKYFKDYPSDDSGLNDISVAESVEKIINNF